MKSATGRSVQQVVVLISAHGWLRITKSVFIWVCMLAGKIEYVTFPDEVCKCEFFCYVTTRIVIRTEDNWTDHNNSDNNEAERPKLLLNYFHCTPSWLDWNVHENGAAWEI